MKGMNNVTTYIDNVLYVKQDARNFVARVRSRLEHIFTEFIEIGKDLKLAQENKYYKELGFNSLEDLSLDLFGIKKTVCYNLIKLYETCSDGDHILPEYKGFSQNQLIELISVKSAPKKFLEITKPEDSVRKIKEARKLWDENKNTFCAWQNNLDKDGVTVDISLDFFDKTENDGLYCRYSSDFSEKAYEIDDLKKWLSDAGFEVKAVFDEDSFLPLRRDSQRAVIVAIKK